MTNTNFDNTFIENFSKEFQGLYSLIRQRGFLLTLVGGALRDYLLTGTLPHDLDFELRHEKEISGDDWILRIKELGEELKRYEKYRVELLPFSIIRLTVGDTLVELSSPRVEKYGPDHHGSVGHKDFGALLSSRPDYRASFLRRDFSINAIGLELDGMNLIDPYNGVRDLKNRILRPLGPDFFKDPVRFLRMIRFFIRFDAKLTGELEAGLQGFDLRSLTSYYFLSEGLKSDFFAFVKMFFEMAHAHKIPLPLTIEKIGFLKNVALEEVKISRPVEILPYLVFHEHEEEGNPGLTLEEIDEFVHFAALKKKTSSNLVRFKLTLEELLDLPDPLSTLGKRLKETDPGEEGIVRLLGRDEFVLLEKFYTSRERLQDIWNVVEGVLSQGPLSEVFVLSESIMKNFDRCSGIDPTDSTMKVSPKLKVRFLIYTIINWNC